MAKSISVSKSTQDGTKLDDLVKEGKALGKMWSTLHSVKQSTKANGFDTRLGKLLIELKAQSSLDDLKLCGSLKTKLIAVSSLRTLRRVILHSLLCRRQ